MSGHEFIRIYDGLLPEDSNFVAEVSKLPSGVSLAESPSLDGEFFQCVARAVKLYTMEFDYFTKLNSIDIADSGYKVVDVNELKGYSEGVGVDCLARIIMFLDDSGSELIFDRHGMIIKAQEGRMVMFPSQWTHPFMGIGYGNVIDTFIVYA